MTILLCNYTQNRFAKVKVLKKNQRVWGRPWYLHYATVSGTFRRQPPPLLFAVPEELTSAGSCRAGWLARRIRRITVSARNGYLQHCTRTDTML